MNIRPRVTKVTWVCSDCRKSARRAYSATARQAGHPAAPPASGAAKLTTRRLISLEGRDAPKFLQGLITNNVRPESRTGFFAAFLTAQGKVLNDVFVYPTLGSSLAKQEESGYMVEVDADQATLLLAHMKRHKLRAKMTLRLLDEGELDVWSAWREEEKWTPHSMTSGEASEGKSDPRGILGLVDTRASGMGQRILLQSGSDHSSPLKSHPTLESLEQVPLSAYTIRRYLRGVPEGQGEIPRDNSFPMNTNIDLMNGIDFKKGCYLGQELTIRTHHTGVVRRRVLPVALFDPAEPAPEQLVYDPETAYGQPSQEADIKVEGKRGRPGKWIGGVGNVGLAMCRLEMMTDLAVSSEPSTFSAEDRFVIETGSEAEGQQNIGTKAFVPDWIKSRIRRPKAQKRVE